MKDTTFSGVMIVAMLFTFACSDTNEPEPTMPEPAQTERIPTFEIETNWPTVPDEWRIGDPSSIAIDAQDNVWVLNRPRTVPPEETEMAAPPLLVFDPDGNFIKGWGGAADGYEWPEREHGLHIDHNGYVWLGGNNCPERNLPGLKPVSDDQVLKFTQDGEFVMQIGASNQSQGNTDTENLHQPADAEVYPETNELFVADGYGNHRVIVFDADTGEFKRMWGAFGEEPIEDDACPTPTLGDTDVGYLDRSDPNGPGPDRFSIVHAISIANDGTVYVADRENRRVQAFTHEGTFINQVVRNDTLFARNLALSSDPDQEFLYVGGGDDIVVVNRSTLEIVTTIQDAEMVGGGHHIETDSQGNIYIAATGSGLQKLTFTGISSP